MQLERKIPLAFDRYILDGAILLFLLALYAPLFTHWYDGWLHKSISTEHEYFSHGLIGIPFAFYIAWTHRHQWYRLPNTSHAIGALLLPLAGILYLSPITDLVNLSLPVMLAGLCFWLKGWAGFRLQQFPLLLVLLATPNELPYLIAPYTLPLQSFIAGTAGFILTQLGMDITVEQIYLLVGGRVVEVAPYCAGLKMLFTSLYVALLLLYWREDLAYRNVIGLFLGGAVLLSVSANIVRNTLLTLFHGIGQDGLFAWLHEGWGGDLYSAAMLGLLIPLLVTIERYFAPLPEEQS
jgi:cyanoexosortase B